MDELLAIGEFSRLSGLSARRLRSYAASGLLVPSAVDSETGYRYYQPGQARDAHVIGLLRTAGVPVAAIGRFLASPSLAAIERWADEAAAEADVRIQALERLKEVLVLGEASPADDLKEVPTVVTMEARGATHTGRTRDVNEDAYVTSGTVAVVADGLGGAPGGERAAGELVRALETSTPRSIEELVGTVMSANHRIWEIARRDRGLAGMGTTVCAVAALDGRLVAMNVGDSRCYLLRQRSITQVTADHTVVADLIMRGELDETMARDHPHRHVLTRAVGVCPDVEPDVVDVEPADGDRILLCTDGLDVLDVDEVKGLLEQGDPETAAEGLVAAAVERGADDDVTVVVIDIHTHAISQDSAEEAHAEPALPTSMRAIAERRNG